MTGSLREGAGLAGKAWQKRDLVFTPDITALQRARRVVQTRQAYKSAVCFSILIDGQIAGCMDFFSQETLTLWKNALTRCAKSASWYRQPCSAPHPGTAGEASRRYSGGE